MSIFNFDKSIPTSNYLEGPILIEHDVIERFLELILDDIENGTFYYWDCIIRQENDLPLTRDQEIALDDLIGEDDGCRIDYLDDRARPQPWWDEIILTIANNLLLEKLDTSKTFYITTTEGWPKIYNCLVNLDNGITLPEGIEKPIDIIPQDLQHKLWIQYCNDALVGLGQEKEITLEDEQQLYRIESYISLLKRHRDSVSYLDLTLEKLLKTIIMPKKDEKIFIRAMMEQLGLASIKTEIAKSL